MARNAPAAYGRSLRVWDDATDDFAVVTGLPVVSQAAYHRLTNDTVLGPGGEEFGIDVRKWAGMDPALLARRGPMLAEVLTRDPRIETADVRITPTRVAGTIWTATIEIVCNTALGPFRRVFRLSDKSLDEIVATVGET